MTTPTTNNPTVSLIVTTYNWPQALELVLASVARQSRLPEEVIVADDGSHADTRQLLERIAGSFPVPLRHSWQEDLGFRAARSRNRAIAAARGDYVLLIDGDMLLHRDFVADHARAAKPGCFVQGVRVLTRPEGGRRLLEQKRLQLGLFERGLERRRHMLHLPWLARTILRTSEGRSSRGIKTCNQGWWRSDLIALNGFDERMVGWGREDKELAARAFNAGLHRRSLRYAGLAQHLYHRERHQDGESANDRFLEESRREGTVRAALGLDQHQSEFTQAPLPDLRG